MIEKEISRQGKASKAYHHFSRTLPYSAALIKHAFERRKKKLEGVKEKNFKEHGNAALTQQQEGLLLGFVLMCSEKSMALQISSMQSFVRILLGVSISKATLQQFLSNWNDLLQCTLE